MKNINGNKQTNKSEENLNRNVVCHWYISEQIEKSNIQMICFLKVINQY